MEGRRDPREADDVPVRDVGVVREPRVRVADFFQQRPVTGNEPQAALGVDERRGSGAPRQAAIALTPGVQRDAVVAGEEADAGGRGQLLGERVAQQHAIELHELGGAHRPLEQAPRLAHAAVGHERLGPRQVALMGEALDSATRSPVG